MSKEEAERRIETAFASGDFEPVYCEACGDGETDCYRPIEAPESEVLTYCSECADELSDTIIPSEEYHN